MSSKLSRTLAVLSALALLALAPSQALAGNKGWGHGGYGHGNGGGHWHGGGGYWRGGYGYYPRPGYVVGVLPPAYTVVSRWGVPYYYGAGAWYRPYGPRFVVVGAPFGAVVPFLPPYYTTVYAGGAPYYCAGDTYYQSVPGGYAVVPAPANVAPQPMAGSGYGYPSSARDDDDELYVYPERGQSESRQSDDRYACHRWAVDQTGYDPTRALEGVQDASAGGGTRGSYQRAMTACLAARGYSVR